MAVRQPGDEDGSAGSQLFDRVRVDTELLDLATRPESGLSTAVEDVVGAELFGLVGVFPDGV